MTPERKKRLEELRRQLSNLTPEAKQELTSRGIITTIEGHAMSLHNTIILYLQANGTTPTVVGGYNQWKAAGRQVMKGQHGFMIWFPVGPKNQDTGDIINPERFYTGTVFDISQTELAGASPSPAPAYKPQPTKVETPTQAQDEIMKGWAIV